MGITTTGTAGSTRIVETTLQLASILATKKAARKAEEDEKAETEDEKEEWGGNVLDAAIDKLGTRK
jgi:hypothetical protein